MNTRCPLKRVPSAACFFTLCRLTMQPPKSYSVGGQRSLQARPQAPGQTTGVAGARYSELLHEYGAMIERLEAGSDLSIELEEDEGFADTKGFQDLTVPTLETENLPAAFSPIAHIKLRCSL
ncbi:UNVERIFIED_CONTAM: hypothetical protein FKN15_058721 [Acipenser sinensis]